MGKLVPRKIEIGVVGLLHRTTGPTRKLLETLLEKHPIEMKLEREPRNRFDNNAIKVIIGEGKMKNLHIGYVPKEIAKVLAPAMDSGKAKDTRGIMTEIDIHEGTGVMLLKFSSNVFDVEKVG